MAGNYAFAKEAQHQEYGQTNAVFEKVKVVGTFLSFHLLSHTEAGHMSPILAEFRGCRGIVAVVVRDVIVNKNSLQCIGIVT